MKNDESFLADDKIKLTVLTANDVEMALYAYGQAYWGSKAGGAAPFQYYKTWLQCPGGYTKTGNWYSCDSWTPNGFYISPAINNTTDADTTDGKMKKEKK